MVQKFSWTLMSMDWTTLLNRGRLLLLDVSQVHINWTQWLIIIFTAAGKAFTLRNSSIASSNIWTCQEDGLLKDGSETIFSKTALKCVKMLHGLWTATKTTSTKSTISTTSLHISSSLPSFTTNLYPEIFTEYVESGICNRVLLWINNSLWQHINRISKDINIFTHYINHSDIKVIHSNKIFKTLP